MSENNITEQHDATENEDHSAESSVKKNLANLFSIAAIILAIVTLAFCFKIYFDAHSTATNLQARNTMQFELKQQLNNLNQLVKNQDTHIMDVKSTLNAQINALQNKQNDLFKNRDENAWVLAETEYLIRLANYNINLVQRPLVALKMLQAADQNLAQLNDPAFINVRRVLAQDITKLQAVPNVDDTAIILKMDALANQVDNLPLMLPEALTTPATSVTQSLNQNWKTKLQQSLHALKNIVVVQRYDGQLKPILSAEQKSYLSQNIQLMLQQAQWALLQRKPDLYRANLTRIQTWLARFYNVQSANAKAFLNTLAELQAINISPSLPDISNALTILKKSLKDKQAHTGAAT